MKQVSLTPQIRTSCLGFGTATLARLDSQKAITEMLSTALDSGITHFDTARLYGFGTMEGMLGNFLGRRRNGVTITTKFGLEPPFRGGPFTRLLIPLKGLIKRMGFLRKRARAFAAKATEGRYDVASARNSLDRSLRELRTDYIDLFLVHEGSPADLANEALLDFLETEKAAGKIRAFGIGANFATTAALPVPLLARYDVVQIPSDEINTGLETISDRTARPVITHSIFTPMAMIAEKLAQSETLRQEWKNQLGIDLHNASALPALLLQSALGRNPQGIALFSATKGTHIRANALAAEHPMPDNRRNLLRKLVLESKP